MLYLITNRKIKRGSFQEIIEDSIRGGVDRVILREKDLDHDELLKLSLRIKEIVKKFNKELIINGNIEVAKEINADGIHCSFNYFMENQFDFNGLIGVSVHSIDEATKVSEKGADYILVSHIYPTDCKKDLKAKGIGFLKEIKEKTEIDIVALGGINDQNIGHIRKVGINNAAVMSYIMSSTSPYVSARKLKDKL